MKAHFILLVLLAWGASVLRAAEGQLPTPPAPAEPREMKLPQPAEKTLANGLRVVVVERPGLPLLSAEFAIKSGGEVDPPERGIARGPVRAKGGQAKDVLRQGNVVCGL